jgi:hypothetical protein
MKMERIWFQRDQCGRGSSFLVLVLVLVLGFDFDQPSG